MTTEEYRQLTKSKTRSKYHAQPVFVDGYRFDSKREAARWKQLTYMQMAGVITALRRQVQFILIDKSEHGRAIRYIADFVYIQDGHEVVEDAKGVQTDVYRLKKRLMAERYGITIQEV